MPSILSPSEIALATPALLEWVPLTLRALLDGMQDSLFFVYFLILFQEECYRVLHQHFSGDRDRLAREANEADSLSLRLLSECRHIWGR